jgi:hypothetical protein
LKEINGLMDRDANSMAELFGALSMTSVTLERVRAWAESLHSRIVACVGENSDWLAQLRQLLSTVFGEPQSLAAGSPTNNRLRSFRESYKTFTTELGAFAAEICWQVQDLHAAADYLAALQESLTGIIGAWPQLRFWTSWQRARHEGEALGLAPIIVRLEASAGNSPDMSALFERSFRRAFLFAVIEQEKVLRDFFGHEHEERIDQFRKLDDKIAALARDVIRARSDRE